MVCCQNENSLKFSDDNFIIQSQTVYTSKGEQKINYKAYLHIPYVSNPIDKDYQSLNIFVPEKINDTLINSTNAPILFDIAVGGYMPVNNLESETPSSRWELALAAGYVVVAPGCRGRSNQSDNGKYYGKAPAAIVDLKAAVKYIRYNDNRISGNSDLIVSVGCSAGGALSALLGASGNSPLYDEYFKEIGAAKANDDIYASACYSPIADLENADMAYEWMYGSIPTESKLEDQNLSAQLKNSYENYQQSLALKGKDDFGTITAFNYKEYLLKYYLYPSLKKYLNDLPLEETERYLTKNTWINESDYTFSFDAYLNHIGRMKGLPAFDDFEKQSPETILFGNDTINARHFTNFSLRNYEKNEDIQINDEIQLKVNMMNAMYFILNKNKGCTNYWWLRNETSDNHTSQTVMINLATILQNNNKNVNTWLFWDGGHCADDDPEGLIEWIGKITRQDK